jgi:hypothetical protein
VSEHLPENENKALYEMLRKQKKFMMHFLATIFTFTGVVVLISQNSPTNTDVPDTRTLYRKLSEDYVPYQQQRFACNRLEEAENFVRLDGSIPDNLYSNYLAKLDKARTAFLVMTIENPQFPKYGDYLDIVDSLIEWTKENRWHQGFWYKDLYLSACY